MSALAYLTLLKAKNRFLEILRKPSQLIAVLAVVLLIGFTAVSAEYSEAVNYRDINELYSIVLVLYSFVFVSVSKNGFHSGASMFSMADINLLFTSPIKSSSILSFGLFQQLGRSLMLGLFILYQSAAVRMHYDVGFSALVYIFLGYVAVVFLGQMTAMLIYSFTCSSEKRQKAVKAVFVLVAGFFVLLAFIMTYVRHGSISLTALSETLENRIFCFFPVSGAATLFIKGAISKSYVLILAGIGTMAALVILFYIIVSRMNTDYYEDVLAATEISFSAITARKEGKAAENAPKNVKVGKIGLTRGSGASVIAEKHKIENRRSRTFLLTPMSLIFVVISVIFSLIFADTPVAVFAANIYMLMFTVGNYRWVKELNYPYVYLIPESAAKKLLYTIKCEIPSLILESAICFLPVLLILKLRIFEVAAMVLARVGFGLLIIGINLLLQRFLGFGEKKVFTYIVYIMLIAVLSVPGIASAVMLGTLLPFNLEFAYLAFAAANVIVSAFLIFASRNILEYAEYNNK